MVCAVVWSGMSARGGRSDGGVGETCLVSWRLLAGGQCIYNVLVKVNSSVPSSFKECGVPCLRRGQIWGATWGHQSKDSGSMQGSELHLYRGRATS